MGVYNLIQELKKQGLFKESVTCGIIPIFWTTYPEVYDFYNEQLKVEKSKMQCISNTAEEFDLSPRRIREILDLFKD